MSDSGVAVPDLPDLGEVNGATSLVADRDGTGRVLASAVLDYVLAQSGYATTVSVTATVAAEAVARTAADAAEASARAAADTAETAARTTAISAEETARTAADNWLAALQTTGDVTASRALETTYTNSGGRARAIMASVHATSTPASFQVLMNGHVAQEIYIAASGQWGSGCIIAPAGATYSVHVDSGTGSLSTWTETW